MAIKLIDQIKEEIKKATLAKKEEEKEALKYLFSLLEKEQLRRDSFSQEEAIALLQKEMKQKKEALLLFKKGKREDLVAQEEKEIAILSRFLPEQASEEEIKKLVKEMVDQGAKDFGSVMGQVMARLKGRADGKTVSQIVSRELKKDGD